MISGAHGRGWANAWSRRGTGRDVYKRQLFHQQFEDLIAQAGIERRGRLVGNQHLRVVQPVSYTHLDVYKRQEEE